jgi:hypothetical protein
MFDPDGVGEEFCFRLRSPYRGKTGLVPTLPSWLAMNFDMCIDRL